MKRENLKPVLLLCLTFLAAISITAQGPEKEKPRVFISDSKSWEMAGGFTANKDIAAGSIRGGARPQTAEIIKTFGEKCPDVIVTLKQEKADYVVLLEHEGGKPGLRKDNKFALFNEEGDSIKSGSTRTVGGAVKESCEALLKDWQAKTSKTDERKNK